MSDAELRENFRAQLDAARWKDLRAHFERNGLIVVKPELDLLDVAIAVSKDETQTVQGWLEKALVGRPTSTQAQTWNTTPEKSFQFLIVQPYVLVQERSH